MVHFLRFPAFLAFHFGEDTERYTAGMRMSAASIRRSVSYSRTSSAPKSPPEPITTGLGAQMNTYIGLDCLLLTPSHFIKCLLQNSYVTNRLSAIMTVIPFVEPLIYYLIPFIGQV